MKTCSKCKVLKHPEDFRRYWGRSSDGLRPICKVCQRQYEAEWRAMNRDKRIQMRLKRRDSEAAYRKEYDRKNRGKMLAMEAIRRSKRLGLPCDLEKHIPALERRVQAGVCELTGLSLNFDSQRRAAWNSPSLDRIVPSKGYTMENVRVVCFCMNAALGSWGEEVLRMVMVKWMKEA